MDVSTNLLRIFCSIITNNFQPSGAVPAGEETMLVGGDIDIFCTISSEEFQKGHDYRYLSFWYLTNQTRITQNIEVNSEKILFFFNRILKLYFFGPSQVMNDTTIRLNIENVPAMDVRFACKYNNMYVIDDVHYIVGKWRKISTISFDLCERLNEISLKYCRIQTGTCS